MYLDVPRSERNNILQLEKWRVCSGIQDFLRPSLCSFHYSMLGLKLSKIEICNWFWVLYGILSKVYLHSEIVSSPASWKANWCKYLWKFLARSKIYYLCTWANNHFWIHIYTQTNANTLPLIVTIVYQWITNSWPNLLNIFYI